MNDRLICREMMLPDILRRFPGCRKVFDRYGLEGCGGPYGPEEALWFFARAHRVDEVRLIEELEAAARTQTGAPEKLAYKPGPADFIYRRFFKGGILSLFTFGCVFGGIVLAMLAWRGSLASLDLRSLIWAHAHAQVSGWVTLFVMGFAYQAFPRFKFARLKAPRLAQATLWLMAAGIVARVGGDLWQTHPAWYFAGIGGGVLELAAVLIFASVIAASISGAGRRTEPYELFVFGALGWMVAAFAFDLWVFIASGGIHGDRNWISFISLYDGPWRDLQLAGFAAGMILGVSQRYLPFVLGFREVPARTARFVFFLWNISLAASIVAYSMLVRTFAAGWGALLEFSILGLLASVLVLACSLRIFSMKVEPDRSVRFIRAAWFWAAAALILLALLPAYDAIVGKTFSHAYFGGYRHAFTVGFISMMIVGVASKVVPTLAGVPAHSLKPLTASFWLINTGNAMRVVFQILTDTQSWAFPLMGASAWFEIAGMALWAIDIWRAMSCEPAEEAAPPQVRIEAGTRIIDIVQAYPETVPVFLEFGFSMIENPVARRTFARSVNIAQACRFRRVPIGAFLAALNECTVKTAPPKLVQLETRSGPPTGSAQT